jgi:hypothetical protein
LRFEKGEEFVEDFFQGILLHFHLAAQALLPIPLMLERAEGAEGGV